MSGGTVLRWVLYGLLGISLFLNAVALGFWLRLREAGTFSGDWRSLPAETRAEFRQALRAPNSELRQRLAALADARAALRAAAEARPYDRAAVEAAMIRVRRATTDLQIAAQEVMLRGFDAAAGQ